MRRLALPFALALVLAAPRARALAWPDVAEHVERDLASSDPALRLAAVEQLDALGLAHRTPLVLKALDDADTSVRVAAAEVAVRARIAHAIDAVLPWLSEHDPRLRIAACDVAQVLPDRRAVAPLARALSDADGNVRLHAALALGAQGTPDATTALLGKLDDPSPPVRIEIARALARLGDRRAVVPLIGKVEDSAADVREAVARALGALGDQRAAPGLILQLRDASAEVRTVALTALAHVHGDDTADAVAPMVTDRDAAVRRAALQTLGELAREGSDGALHALVTRLGDGDDATAGIDADPLREALVRARGRTAPTLAGLLSQASPQASASIAWVLGALEDKANAPAIIAAMRRGTLAKVAALHALAGAGRPDDLPAVLELVADESPDVRAQAFAAAHALLDPAHPDGRAVDPLMAVMDAMKPTSAEKVKVVGLLARTGARRASPLLQRLAAGKDVAVKVAALDALAELGPTGADDVLVPLVADANATVRLHAALALASSGGARARDALLVKLRDGTELDRAIALDALAGILTRAPSDAAWKQLRAALDLAAAGERDAILLAFGRGAPVRGFVAELVLRGDADDRRTLAEALAGRVDAAPLLLGLLGDADPSVRAEAAWSLGSTPIGDAVAALVAATAGAASGHDAAIDTAVDATGALARIVGRGNAVAAVSALCALVGDSRPLVRANALAGLALGRVRCGDGAKERARLEDPSPRVRLAAARAVAASPGGTSDTAALARCVATDIDGDVADACGQGARAPSGDPHAVLVYVEGAPRSDPKPGAPYLVELADGVLHAGTTDRRGAFFDARAPDGTLTIR